MRIVMVAPGTIPIPGNGSVEICMLSIAKQLAKNHQVTILNSTGKSSLQEKKIGRVKIVELPCKGAYISSVVNYISRKPFDWIQVDNRPRHMAKIKAHFHRTPVSLFLHSLTFVPQNSEISRSMRAADVIIANSSSLKRNLSQRFPSVAHKIRMVHLGVDVERFKPMSKELKRSVKKQLRLGDSYTVLFAGRVIPRKGVPVLIRAVRMVRKQIPNCKLLVVGGGKRGYVQSLKALATELNVPVHFIGKIPHSKIHRIFGAADCFVCPSQRHEAFGLVNVEALAAGTPVVASDIGGIGEIVKPGFNGYLVNSYKSPEQFAGYIVRLGKDRSLARTLSRNGRNDVLARFSWRQTAAKLSKNYKAE